MVELDHQRSVANTLVNKMRLETFVLTYLIIAGLRQMSMSLQFNVLIHFDEYRISFL